MTTVTTSFSKIEQHNFKNDPKTYYSRFSTSYKVDISFNFKNLTSNNQKYLFDTGANNTHLLCEEYINANTYYFSGYPFTEKNSLNKDPKKRRLDLIKLNDCIDKQDSIRIEMGDNVLSERVRIFFKPGTFIIINDTLKIQILSCICKRFDTDNSEEIFLGNIFEKEKSGKNLISTPPQISSTPPQISSTPPQISSTPPKSSSTPPKSSSTPPQIISTPPKSSSKIDIILTFFGSNSKPSSKSSTPSKPKSTTNPNSPPSSKQKSSEEEEEIFIQFNRGLPSERILGMDIISQLEMNSKVETYDVNNLTLSLPRKLLDNYYDIFVLKSNMILYCSESFMKEEEDYVLDIDKTFYYLNLGTLALMSKDDSKENIYSFYKTKRAIILLSIRNFDRNYYKIVNESNYLDGWILTPSSFSNQGYKIWLKDYGNIISESSMRNIDKPKINSIEDINDEMNILNHYKISSWKNKF